MTRFDPETLQLLTAEPVPEILIQDRQGHLWFGNENELCSLRSPTPSSPLDNPLTPFIKGEKGGRGVVGSLRSPTASPYGCLFERQQNRQTFNARVCSLMEDSRGAFWVGTNGDGLYCDDFDQVSINSTRRLNPADSSDAVQEGAGGAQRHPEKWGKRFTTEDGLGSNSVLSLLEAQDGTIWVGTQGNPGYLCRAVYLERSRRDGKAFEAIPTPRSVIFRLFEDSQGRIWMGGWNGGGLSCYDGEKLVTYTTADGLPDDKIQSIVEDDTGCLWIGTAEGLCCFDGKQFTTYGKAQGLFSLQHQWSTKDATGQLWFGTLGGGLYRTDGKHFQWDLMAEVQAGRFREDLYYRLNVFPIHIPALRERLDDIPLLAEHLLQKYCHQNTKDIGGFAPGVFEMLQSYSWPGNVRELESAINYAAAFVETGQRIQAYHFPAQITQGESLIQEVLSEQGKYRELLDQFQRRLIENALKTCSGNRYQAAKMLGMDRSNLVKLIKRLDIDKKDL